MADRSWCCPDATRVMLPGMKSESAAHDNAVRCVAYTRWLALGCLLAFTYVAWQTFKGAVDWDAGEAAFPWLGLLGSAALLGIGSSAGASAQLAHHELVRLIRSERKLQRLDPAVDLLD